MKKNYELNLMNEINSISYILLIITITFKHTYYEFSLFRKIIWCSFVHRCPEWCELHDMRCSHCHGPCRAYHSASRSNNKVSDTQTQYYNNDAAMNHAICFERMMIHVNLYTTSTLEICQHFCIIWLVLVVYYISRSW